MNYTVCLVVLGSNFINTATVNTNTNKNYIFINSFFKYSLFYSCYLFFNSIMPCCNAPLLINKGGRWVDLLIGHIAGWYLGHNKSRGVMGFFKIKMQIVTGYQFGDQGIRGGSNTMTRQQYQGGGTLFILAPISTIVITGNKKGGWFGPPKKSYHLVPQY